MTHKRTECAFTRVLIGCQLVSIVS